MRTAAGDVLILLTRPCDPASEALAAAWPGPARTVTPADLSRPGWRYRSDAPEAARLVAGGEVIEAGEIGGVVTRLGWITAEELSWIDPTEREFVAAEMGAFLLALLFQLGDRVLNPPTPQCLAGPFFAPTAWRGRAREAGFELAGTGARVAGCHDVIGGQTLEGRFRPSAWAAARLAKACQARLLAVSVTEDGAFIDAAPFVDLAQPRAARAALEVFQQARAA